MMEPSSASPRNLNIPLENPWPPTPPNESDSISSHSAYDGVSEHELMVAAHGTGSARIVRVYNVLAVNTPIQFFVTIVPTPGQPSHHTFSLSVKAGGIHRSICTPLVLRLTFDPRNADFDVFLFPPKSSLPKNSLFSLRVWLRHQGIEHRIFSEDTLWIGTDPDFEAIPNLGVARPVHTMPSQQLFEAYVGKARVLFIIKWQWLKESVFSFSFEYEAGGVGRMLFENLVLRLDCPPQDISCHIYTIPMQSKPPGASHRLRVWLKSPSLFNSEDDMYQSYIYQRVWTTDDFRIGADLDFREIDRRVIMGELAERPPRMRINSN